MKNLILTVSGIIAISFLVLGLIARVPSPKVKTPDSRYSAGAISTTTVQGVQDYTVLISNEDMGERWRGTGVLLSSTTILTCAHIIPKDKTTKNLWIYPYPGAQVVKATLKFIDQSNDLALLELTTPVLGHKTPVLASKVEIGEPIVSVGNIRGYMVWFVSYGIISGEHSRWLLSDAMIRGGNSGGPWANAKGELVALTDVGWQDYDDESMVAGGIPVQDLQKFLVRAKRKSKETGE